MSGKIRIIITLNDKQNKQIEEYYDVINFLANKNSIDDLRIKYKTS